MFFCEICEIFKNSFFCGTSPVAASDSLRSFSEQLFYGAPLGNCLFHTQVPEFQPADRVKIISQVLFKHFMKGWEVATPKRSFT